MGNVMLEPILPGLLLMLIGYVLMIVMHELVMKSKRAV